MSDGRRGPLDEGTPWAARVISPDITARIGSSTRSGSSRSLAGRVRWRRSECPDYREPLSLALGPTPARLRSCYHHRLSHVLRAFAQKALSKPRCKVTQARRFGVSSNGRGHRLETGG
jgi:hypothetical protein